MYNIVFNYLQLYLVGFIQVFKFTYDFFLYIIMYGIFYINFFSYKTTNNSRFMYNTCVQIIYNTYLHKEILFYYLLYIYVMYLYIYVYIHYVLSG